MLTDYRRQITNRTEIEISAKHIAQIVCGKIFQAIEQSHMCRWYCLFSNCCRASHRPCINRRSSADKSRVKPISAFALISWGAHGHTHASQTTSLTRLLIPHLC